jgi:hypothetical protein
MQFIVTRTGYSDEKPCPEAKPITYTSIDERTVDDPEKIVMESGGRWYSRGENHRVENGRIKRDFPGREAWAIEINSIEELAAFMQKHGRLVIEPHYSNRDYTVIEIYDGYRE